MTSADSTNPPVPPNEPQGIFVYGTLMAESLLSWLLTGSSQNHSAILSLRQPAILKNYRRVPVKHGDYPAVIKGSISDQVDGFLVIPESASQWKKMDDFEGEVYRRECVQVYLTQSNTLLLRMYSFGQTRWRSWRRTRNGISRILKRIGWRIGWTCLMGWKWLGKVSSVFIVPCLALLLIQLSWWYEFNIGSIDRSTYNNLFK